MASSRRGLCAEGKNITTPMSALSFEAYLYITLNVFTADKLCNLNWFSPQSE
jgi:hypothetical protein